MEKVKRYLVFLCGLFISSLGVSFITKAALGTSPISAIPYVLSLASSLTLGEYTILFSLLLVALQLILLRRSFQLEHWLQIPISIIFGYFIDLTMLLLAGLQPYGYVASLFALLAGCAILAIGVYLEVVADVAMLPGESFVRAVCTRWDKLEFGTMKVVFDGTMAVCGGVLSLCFWQKLQGVREGTIVAALLVGFLVRIMTRYLGKLDFLWGRKPKEAEEESLAVEQGEEIIKDSGILR